MQIYLNLTKVIWKKHGLYWKKLSIKGNNHKFKVSDNSITTNKTLISDKFNDFFTSIGPSLAKQIPQQNVSPMEYMKEKLVNSMFMEPVKEDEVTTIISNLNNSAPGHEITAGTLKGILAAISHPLVYILNLSLSEGLFPDELKIANVVPIYKADDSMKFNNYRPVCIIVMYPVKSFREGHVY